MVPLAFLRCPNHQPRSRGSTGRRLSQPLGNERAPSVQEGNLMVSRCALLILLASAKGIWWVMEQPRGSLLEHHPLMEEVFRRVKVFRHHIRMIDYAASTEKGTWLYSSTLVFVGWTLFLSFQKSQHFKTYFLIHCIWLANSYVQTVIQKIEPTMTISFSFSWLSAG